MPAPTTEIEPIEPQLLKKLSFKSLKRALDLFAPVHGQFPPPDSEALLFFDPQFSIPIFVSLKIYKSSSSFFFFCSKKIRLSHKMKVAYGGVEPVSQPPCQPNRSNEQAGPSNALALTETRLLDIAATYKSSRGQTVDKSLDAKIRSTRIIGEKQFKMAVELFNKATEKLQGKIGYQHQRVC